MIVSFMPLLYHDRDSTYGKYVDANKRLIVKVNNFPLNYKETGHTYFEGKILSNIEYGKKYKFDLSEIRDLKFHEELALFE